MFRNRSFDSEAIILAVLARENREMYGRQIIKADPERLSPNTTYSAYPHGGERFVVLSVRGAA